MKTYSPILYDREGNEIAWFVSEISAEQFAQLKWGWAHAIKNCGESFRTPIIEDGENK